MEQEKVSRHVIIIVRTSETYTFVFLQDKSLGIW